MFEHAASEVVAAGCLGGVVDRRTERGDEHRAAQGGREPLLCVVEHLDDEVVADTLEGARYALADDFFPITAVSLGFFVTGGRMIAMRSLIHSGDVFHVTSIPL